jgi:DNA-directed RNA polymerase subunit M/transcription elongation factor TFIIS
MAVSKIICPECEKVLRPAKPVAEGKSVTCPDCGARFRVPTEDLDLAIVEEPKPRKKSSKSSAGKSKDPATKDKVKSSKEAVASAASAKAAADDDDEGGGTYGLIGEKEDANANQPKITYAPDTSIKDLRGPAQEAVMPPTNLLILTAALGFFGWLAFIVALLIPTLLPLTDEEGRSNMPKNIMSIGSGMGTPTRTKDGKDPATLAEKDIQTALTSIQQAIDSSSKAKEKVNPDDLRVLVLFDYDLAWIANLEPGIQVVVFLPLILGMVYCGGVILGAVSAQNLEARNMGIVSACMVMVPVTVGGLAADVAMLFGFLITMVIDAETTYYVQIGIFTIFSLAAVGVGVWNLMVLNQEMVVEGFNYVPAT